MQRIKEAQTLFEVSEDLAPHKGTWLFLDVDGTLIHPVDAIFRAPKAINPFFIFF